MLPRKLLIANRGEIAIRIMRTAAEMGIETVAVYARDDAQALHTRKADESHPLAEDGVPAYLNGGRLLEIAAETGCDAVHPGYGFLSENAEFARRCAAQDVTFVGPGPEILSLFGDKARARALAEECGVPILRGTSAAATLGEARVFLSGLGPEGAIMVKAVAGGAAGASGWCGRATIWRAPTPTAARKRCAHSATGKCMSSASSRTRGTLKCRCSVMAAAP